VRIDRLGKRLSAAALCLVLAAASSAEGRGEASPPAASAKPSVMKIAHAQPVTHPRHESLLKFKELMERRTGGSIKVEVYPAAQLGDEAYLLDATKRGTIQGTRCGLFERVTPRLLVLTMPFLFDSLDGIEKVTMGPIGERLASSAEENGLLVLTVGDAGGFRQITNNRRPILRPEDLRGLKIRVPGVATIAKTLEAFGAEVVTIPYGETYAALASGVVDGQENPTVNIEAMKFYEVQKYLTMLDYQFHPDPFCVNPDWFRSLDAERQKIVKECAEESMRYNNRLIRAAGAKAYETMRNALDVSELTAAQRQSFKDKARPVYDFFIAEGVMTSDELEEIRASAR
jgi:C4-dicarboxylate-binding protein DctP